MPHIIQLLEKSSSTSHVKSKVIDIVSNLVNSVKDDQTALITNIGKTAVKIVDSNSDGLYLMSFLRGNLFFFGVGKKIFIVSKQKIDKKYKRLIYTTYINYIPKKIK